jgi:effector-binding domain-containing protein
VIDPPRIIETAEQPLALLHLTVPRNQIQTVMGPGLAEVTAALAAQGVEPSGPWFTHHLKMDPEVFDFEICLPVAAAVAASGRVRPGLWPAMKLGRTVYHGPFQGLGAAWGEFDAWVVAQGLTPASDLWERYLQGPESSPDPASWRTELNRPLVG